MRQSLFYRSQSEAQQARDSALLSKVSPEVIQHLTTSYEVVWHTDVPVSDQEMSALVHAFQPSTYRFNQRHAADAEQFYSIATASLLGEIKHLLHKAVNLSMQLPSNVPPAQESHEVKHQLSMLQAELGRAGLDQWM